MKLYYRAIFVLIASFIIVYFTATSAVCLERIPDYSFDNFIFLAEVFLSSTRHVLDAYVFILLNIYTTYDE